MKNISYIKYDFFEILKDFIIHGYSKKTFQPANEKRNCTFLEEYDFYFDGYDGEGMYAKDTYIRNNKKPINAEIKIYTTNWQATANGIQIAQGVRLHKIVEKIKKDEILKNAHLELFFDESYGNGALIINDLIVLQFYANKKSSPKNYFIITIESDFSFDDETLKKKIATKTARVLNEKPLPQFITKSIALARLKKALSSS
ncbi:hypothetical protein [Chromobacterium haemolyticum]|uniref:hypothetical protein n=1 Tax=Chromobacterium haemolyticum TaxID=394935 RepID=UPI0024472585|nr:hypothetical protein [Chromobacterium haemolyticum]MDH0344192.1 hypothetical protein [Chromobacterium haemolyticum]MDH0344194.1 hypothetical protein [Chromobacterium haemolyticum]